MNDKAPKQAPDRKPTSSLYRFCLSHGLSLSPEERCAEGVALSKVARERELPLVKGRERIEDRWIRSRLYPVSFLGEWLVRYREANAAASAAEPLPEAAATSMPCGSDVIAGSLSSTGVETRTRTPVPARPSPAARPQHSCSTQ